MLIVTDSAWASQLRYSLPELRDRLRREGQLYQLTSIKMLIDDAISTAVPTKPRTLRPISMKSRKIIADLAQECSYSPLKQVLLRLSER